MVDLKRFRATVVITYEVELSAFDTLAVPPAALSAITSRDARLVTSEVRDVEPVPDDTAPEDDA